jgi:hypothetical protein
MWLPSQQASCAARDAAPSLSCAAAAAADARPPPAAHAGFEKPSAIQQKGIVPFGKGLDVIQQAQSGTGKTATFCAGILQVRHGRLGRR